MFSKNKNFAHYSKAVSWVVAVLSLGVSVVTFVGDSPNAVLLGFLWLALAGVFCLSGMYIGSRSRGESGSQS